MEVDPWETWIGYKASALLSGLMLLSKGSIGEVWSPFPSSALLPCEDRAFFPLKQDAIRDRVTRPPTRHGIVGTLTLTCCICGTFPDISPMSSPSPEPSTMENSKYYLFLSIPQIPGKSSLVLPKSFVNISRVTT